MKAGDIIFIRGDSLISKVITMFDGEFSHVAVAVSSTHIVESQRFVKTRILPYYFDDSQVKIINLNLTEEERDLIVHIAIQMTGKGYDYLQFFGMAFQKLFKFKKEEDFANNPNKYICSELVDLILYALGKIDDEEYLGDKTPNELYEYLSIRLKEENKMNV